MKLAFCLFKYFPYGGLQRDFLRIARACSQRGHEIHVYTMSWEDELEPVFNLHLVEVEGWQNHTRNRLFADKVKAYLDADNYDLIIGFNKMPHLDVYYAADACYQTRVREQRSFFYRLSPRYRQLVAFEEAVFGNGNKTEIMVIAPRHQSDFVHHYQTELERFHILPPGITRDRIAPPDADKIRIATRNSLQILPTDILLLMVGSGFKTKGLDRTIIALASLPETLKKHCHLYVIGQDNPVPFQKLAQKLKVADKLNFLGGRSDVPNFLLVADLLLHPAYNENTGTVLLEAIISGLPVLTVDVCGYAHYVSEAKCGMVLSSPFQQDELNIHLQKMLLSPDRNEWRQNGLSFAKSADIYAMPDKAADLIEFVGQHSQQKERR